MIVEKLQLNMHEYLYKVQQEKLRVNEVRIIITQVMYAAMELHVSKKVKVRFIIFFTRTFILPNVIELAKTPELTFIKISKFLTK